MDDLGVPPWLGKPPNRVQWRSDLLGHESNDFARLSIVDPTFPCVLLSLSQARLYTKLGFWGWTSKYIHVGVSHSFVSSEASILGYHMSDVQNSWEWLTFFRGGLAIQDIVGEYNPLCEPLASQYNRYKRTTGIEHWWYADAETLSEVTSSPERLWLMAKHFRALLNEHLRGLVISEGSNSF